MDTLMGAHSPVVIGQMESGVHRVQRVPTTESKGRVHTSTAVVTVLPEPSKAEEQMLLDRDIRIETFRAGENSEDLVGCEAL